MSMQNPIADMFTSIRNAQAAKKKEVIVPSSKLKENILEVLKKEGYITEYAVYDQNGNLRSSNEQEINPKKWDIKIELKYVENVPAIEEINQISKPSLRVYRPSHKIKPVMEGMGISIISTPKGLLTDKEARKMNQGGEVLASVI